MNLVEQKQHIDLSSNQKWAIICWSLHNYDFDKKQLKDGANKAICAKFEIGKTTLRQILHDYRQQIEAGEQYPDLEPKKKNACGPHCKLTEEIEINIRILHYVTEGKLPIDLFVEQYKTEFGGHMCRHTMEKYLCDLGYQTYTAHVKPHLTTRHRLARIEFVLNLIESDGAGGWRFKREYRIHLDEKWFYTVQLKTVKRKLADEPFSYATVTHKGHIPKIMFLSAISHPLFFIDESGHRFDFNGKLGIFPFIHEGMALRDSVNRLAGAPVLEDVSVTAEVFFNTMVEEVLPTIRAELPFLKDERIVIQLDNAPPHIGEYNPQLLGIKCLDEGWNIVLEFQPKQSPDFNTNDLCFFNSLNKAVHQIKAANHSREQLLAAVKEAYAEYDVAVLARMEGLQYEIYRQVLANEGGNQFPIPHSGVRERQASGEDPCDRTVPPQLYQFAVATKAALQLAVADV